MTSAMINPNCTPGSQQRTFSAVNIVRRQAPASRPYGRFAVALRASLDPDALRRRAQDVSERKKNRSGAPLDRPRSFRDDPPF
jgi:hypothetical protein